MKTISQILGVVAVAALVVVSLQAESLTSPKQSGTTTPAVTACCKAQADHCNKGNAVAEETGCCHATATCCTEKDGAMACAKPVASPDKAKAAMGGCCQMN